MVSRILSFAPPPPLPCLHLAARSLDPKMISLVLAKEAAKVDAPGGEEWNGNTPLGVLASLCSCEAMGHNKCRGHRKEELFTAGDNEAEVEDEYLSGNGGNGHSNLGTSPLGTSMGSHFGRSLGSNAMSPSLSGIPGLRSLGPSDMTPNDSILAAAELLISKGASIDHVNATSEPILFLALGSHSDALAHIILEKGAWYEQPGKDGKGNPLHLAAACFLLPLTRELLFRKVEEADDAKRLSWLTMEDSNGYLPIHYAAQAGDADLVRRMVEDWEPSLLDATTGDGETALCIAAHYGHPRTVEILLKLGADPAKRDSRGLLALDYAGTMGHIRTSFALHRSGASDLKAGPPPGVCQNLVGGCDQVLATDSERDCRRCGGKRYCSVECA